LYVFRYHSVKVESVHEFQGDVPLEKRVHECSLVVVAGVEDDWIYHRVAPLFDCRKESSDSAIAQAFWEKTIYFQKNIHVLNAQQS